MRTEPAESAPLPALLRGDGPARRLAIPLLEAIAGIAHGFTVIGSEPGHALREAAGRDRPLVTLKQVHGRVVHVVSRAEPENGPLVGDALLTERPGLAIAVHVADCVPILLCDPARGIVGAVHAGWRGTVAGVLPAAIAAARALGSRPEDLRVALGPAIGPCCFVVGPEVAEAWRRADPEAERSLRQDGDIRMDLTEGNRLQARRLGVPESQIAAAGLCTACRPDLLESYRRSRGAGGRMTAFIVSGPVAR